MKQIDNSIEESLEKEEMPSTIKKSFNYEENDPISDSKVRKLSYSDSEEDFCQNEFEKNEGINKNEELKNTMEQFFGYEKVENTQIDQNIEESTQKQRFDDNECIDKGNSERQRDGIKLLTRILNSRTKIMKINALNLIHIETVSKKYTGKIQSAAEMVDKMSKFSRNFIAVNSLNAVFTKKRLKNIMNKFNIWKNLSLKYTYQDQSIGDLEFQKEQENKILLAYKDSAKKLENIEQKYSQENQNLRNQLQESFKEIELKNSELKTQKNTIRNLESLSNPVSEAICPK